MIITNVRRNYAGGPNVAHFDLEIGAAEIRVVNCLLKRNASGELRVFAPTPGDSRVVTFSPAFAGEIIAAAQVAMGGRVANDTHRNI